MEMRPSTEGSYKNKYIVIVIINVCLQWLADEEGATASE